MFCCCIVLMLTAAALVFQMKIRGCCRSRVSCPNASSAAPNLSSNTTIWTYFHYQSLSTRSILDNDHLPQHRAHFPGAIRAREKPPFPTLHHQGSLQTAS